MSSASPSNFSFGTLIKQWSLHVLVTAEAGAWMPYSPTIWAQIQPFEAVHPNISPVYEMECRQEQRCRITGMLATAKYPR